MTLRLLQGRDDKGACRVIVACDADSFVLAGVDTIYALAMAAIAAGEGIATTIARLDRGAAIDVAAELASGRILAPIGHDDAAHLHMTGTGLTHLGSAEGRDTMHRAAAAEHQTDSMRMFREGLAGGKPAAGKIGQQPEWFYKGDGTGLIGPGATFDMPAFAQDGGEEPELAGIYVIGPDGTPFRLGFVLANEFSDHVTERHNYLWLAHSKLRQAAIGPELLFGAAPDRIEGTSRILRDGVVVWERPFVSGEANMSHSFANLEHHHFKYAQFRQPGDVHVHFFGTATLSFSDGVRTQEGDEFEIAATPFTLPLRNRLGRAVGADRPVTVTAL
ncbi:AraD1 family protein [Sphingomonas sp. CLY1604]|uniref:AraD1 family protein n=1 Tax=Sphingomonas sp. CLY1604 TaxID=3457786 RepID=UPI003FD80948